MNHGTDVPCVGPGGGGGGGALPSGTESLSLGVPCGTRCRLRGRARVISTVTSNILCVALTTGSSILTLVTRDRDEGLWAT